MGVAARKSIVSIGFAELRESYTHQKMRIAASAEDTFDTGQLRQRMKKHSMHNMPLTSETYALRGPYMGGIIENSHFVVEVWGETR